MAGYTRPDVYITEQLLQSAPSFFPSITPAAFVGYTLQGPTTPQLVTSWNQFQRLYGGFTNTVNDALALQVYQYFACGGSYVYVVRALGTGSASATLTLQDRQGTPANILIITADSAGAWGNGVYVEIVDTGISGRFNLNVRLGSATTSPIERFTDLSMNPADTRNAINVINAGSTGSNYITVATPNNWIYNPSSGTPAASSVGSGGTALSGGADSTSPPTTGASGQIITALNLLNAVTVGLLVNLVGVVDATTINAAIAWCAARNDSFLVIDPGFGLTSSGVATYRGTLTVDSHGAMYWPNIVINDPSSNTPGATKTVSPSGSVMGQYATTDAAHGTAKAPAGTNTALANVVALETPSPQPSDYDALSAGNVNGIRYYQSYGFVIWGSKTLKATGADSQVSVRRTLMAVEAAIKQVTLFAVEEINDSNLWATVTSQIKAVLQQLYQQGGLRGSTPDQAYFVTCDASNNTPQTIAAGELHVTVGISLQYPAQFIIINVGQFDGSNTVLESAL